MMVSKYLKQRIIHKLELQWAISSAMRLSFIERPLHLQSYFSRTESMQLLDILN